MSVMVDGEPIRYDLCPERAREVMMRYIESGIDPGSGYRMILSGDIMAVCAVDRDTLAILPDLIRWLHCRAPHGCWNSRERVETWMRQLRELASIREIVDAMRNIPAGLGQQKDGTFRVNR